MTPTIYCADHQHAKVVCSAFAEGCDGRLVPATSRVKPGMAAMWGILRGAGERIKECELYGVPYFYIDHGYFGRGHYDGYYRVVFCDRHLQGPPRPSDGKRWEALGLTVLPRGVRPGNVLYLPISHHVAAYMGIDAGAFDARHIADLKERYHDSEIVVKTKDDGELADHLTADIAVVAGFQSNALLEADLLGFPVLELGNGPTKHMEGGAAVRKACFEWLADNQWTLQEMRSGKCWADLMARYGDRLAEAA